MWNTLLKTRQEMRDDIRRKLQIVPPVDYQPVPGNPGDTPQNAPNPGNAAINDALQDAISDINRYCGFHINEFSVPVDAGDSSSYGPFALDLSNLTPNTSADTLEIPTARVRDVSRVLWTADGSSAPILLEPSNRNALDRGGTNAYYALLPGLPQTWYVLGYVLYITPAQSQSGTFTITCGTGVCGWQTEGDFLEQVPIDFQPVFAYQALVRLAKTQTMDIEASERAAMFAPDAILGMQQFKAWKEGESGTPPTSLSVFTYRSGYGTRRTTR